MKTGTVALLLALLVQVAWPSSVLAAESVNEPCVGTRAEPGLTQIHATGWGFDARNTRYRGADSSSIRAANVAGLKLSGAISLRTTRLDPCRSSPKTPSSSAMAAAWSRWTGTPAANAGASRTPAKCEVPSSTSARPMA